MHAHAPCGATRSKKLVVGASGLALFLLTLSHFGGSSRLRAQDEMGTVIFTPHRELNRRFEEGQGLISGGRYAEGVGFLGGILAGGEDYFFRPDPAQPVYRSLKSEARRVLAELPAEGRQAYELHYAAGAARQLEQAAQSGDQAALEAVARRWPLTPAGAQAALAVGLRLAEQGRAEAAALAFHQAADSPVAPAALVKLAGLYEAACRQAVGQGPAAQAALVALKQRFPQSPPTVAGQARPWFPRDEDALAWLQTTLGPGWPQALGATSNAAPTNADTTNSNEATPHHTPVATNEATPQGDWLLAGGSPARHAASSGGLPLLNPRWRVRTAEHPTIERLVAGLRSAFTDQQTPALPAGQPLAIGDLVLMRTARKLVAVDFVTGKRIWEAAPWEDDAFERLLEAGRGQQMQRAMNSSKLALVLEQRLWDDAAYGGLSSDGRCVYLLEELGFTSGLGDTPSVLLPGGQRRLEGSWPKTFNRLAARELKTEGKLLWEVGGATGEAEPALAGAFFLGAPLPLWDRLWALAELQGEIRLVELEATTGQQLWSQPLAVVERNIVEDAVRRLAGASPSYADGVLVCPTSAGAVVAVDLASRSLLWGYHYPRTRPAYRERLGAARLGYGDPTEQGSSFSDAVVTLADGKVLLAPPEADELHCLNLADGRLLWKQPRGENLYLGAVDAGLALLVGKQQVTAVRLADGVAAWSTKLPDEALPTGRGYLSDGVYELPLSNGTITPVELATGKLGTPVRAQAGQVLGNLVCHRGQVLSQGVDWLETFDQRAPLERRVEATLARTPDDPWALARRGELRQAAGQDALAVEDFRRAYGGYRAAQTEAQRSLDAGGPRRPWQQATAGVVQTRGLLVEGLLAALGRDFVAHRDFVAEVEPLIERPEQRVALWRLTAAGWQRSGQIPEALAAYLALANLEPSAELEQVEPGLEVRRDRWLNARLTELRGQASAAEQAQIDAAVDARLTAARQAGTAAAYGRFLDQFSGQPAANVARAELARLQQQAGHLLAAEQLWRRLADDGPPELVREATARLAVLLDRAGRPDEAARQYRILNERWPHEPCLDGQTGQQLTAALPTNSPTAARLHPQPWPTGNVQVKQQNNATPQPSSSRPLIPDQGYRALGEQITLEFDPSQRKLFGVGPHGDTQWEFTLGELADIRFGFNYSPTLNYARNHGSYWFIQLGYQQFALDALASPTSPKLLWKRDLLEAQPGLSGNLGFQTRSLKLPWGGMRNVPSDALGHVGYPAALSTALIFQHQRAVIALDPLTGETLWRRTGFPPGSMVAADDELTIVLEPTAQAVVLNTCDGSLVERRAAPLPEQRMAAIGRKLLVWEEQNATPCVALIDLASGERLWEHLVEPGSQAYSLDWRELAILNRSGTFQMLELPSGRLLVDAKLPATNFEDFRVLPLAETWVLLVNRGWAGKETPTPQPALIQGLHFSGHLYAYDRADGRERWNQMLSGHSIPRVQPAALPVLTVVANYTQPTNQNRTAPWHSLQALDARTGTPLAIVPPTGGTIRKVTVQGDPATRRLRIETSSETLELAFD